MLHHLNPHVYGDCEREIGMQSRRQIPLSNYVPPNVSLAHSFTISRLLATSDRIAASVTRAFVLGDRHPGSSVLGCQRGLLPAAGICALGGREQGRKEKGRMQINTAAWLEQGELVAEEKEGSR